MRDKNEIQKEIIDVILEKDFRGIMLASVRSGKTRQLIKAMQGHYKGNSLTLSILVAYPNIDVKNSWVDEFAKLAYFPNVTFTTFISLHKFENNLFDYVIFDEAHSIPEENVLPIAGKIAKNNKNVIFASGTYTNDTLCNIKMHTGLSQIVNYTTEQAIADGIVSDFTIFVHRYDLDNKIKLERGKVKKWNSSDKSECGRLTRFLFNSYGEAKKFAAINRMRFINSNNTLVNRVQTWINDNPDKRFLLFASDEKTGIKYGIKMYNSKNSSDKILLDFQKEEINQLCLIKKASSGVTFPNLSHVLITAINSNGEFMEQMLGRSLLNDTEHSNIHVFVSTEEFQIKWMLSAFEKLPKEKIIYI